MTPFMTVGSIADIWDGRNSVFGESGFLDGKSIADMLQGKSKIINKAIQDIGMGRYQWQLFVLCGFGWLADK